MLWTRARAFAHNESSSNSSLVFLWSAKHVCFCFESWNFGVRLFLFFFGSKCENAHSYLPTMTIVRLLTSSNNYLQLFLISQQQQQQQQQQKQKEEERKVFTRKTAESRCVLICDELWKLLSTLLLLLLLLLVQPRFVSLLTAAFACRPRPSFGCRICFSETFSP